MTPPPFRRLSAYLVERYGERVHKVCLHCGFSCPNRDGTIAEGGCAFCSGPSLHPVGYRPGQQVDEQLADGMRYIEQRHRSKKFIAYYQDYSATYLSADELRELYAPALADPRIVGLAVSTRPDCLPPPVLELLAEVAEEKDLWVELGLQIADDQVLDDLNRGHTVAQFCDAVSELHNRRLPVCAHVIIGLPGVSAEIEARTSSLLARLGVWGVKVHAFHIIENTEMARRHAADPLPLLSLDQYARRAVDFVQGLPRDVVIHRLTGEAPRHLTVAPKWTINKLAVYDRVVEEFERRQNR